jgi:tetratricopeptide (TPR) repeat protein
MNRGVQLHPNQHNFGAYWGPRLLSLALLLAVLSAAGCAKLKARDQLNKGVQSYKNSRYEEAIEHFKNAAALDPGLVNARLYLATAYAKLYIPGAQTEENKRMAYSAIEEYKRALTQDPGNLNAIKGIALLYVQTKNFDQAKQYYQKAAAVSPNDPDNFQAIGVIDWNTAYSFRQEQRLKLGLKPTDQLKDKKVCAAVKAANEGPVEEGMKMLQKALQIRPDYEDAMTYMNLLYRERADYQCDNPSARAADTNAAIEWQEKALAIRKAKVERQNQAAAGGASASDQKKQE